jgi:hypothetical protein
MRPGGPHGVVGKQLAVLLHRRSAARGVDDDAVDAGAFEDLDVVARQGARLVDVARVERECAAAALRGRRGDAASFGREHIHRRAIDVGKRETLDAPGQQSRGQALCARGGRLFGHSCEERAEGRLRRDLQKRAQAPRQQSQEPAAPERAKQRPCHDKRRHHNP